MEVFMFGLGVCMVCLAFIAMEMVDWVADKLCGTGKNPEMVPVTQTIRLHGKTHIIVRYEKYM
jgi:hypothetical protein